MTTTQVYSKKIIRFIHEIKSIIKDILSKEVFLRVTGERFYDRRLESTYPINVVIYNNKTMLGYFGADFYELGFHELLMHSSKARLRNIIRHELAHYITFINYGSQIQPHGSEFRAFCQRTGWSEEVYSATESIDESGGVPVVEDSAILRKVQKLMALASSSNANEAEQAMVKSQQLLLKHNIDSKYMESDDDEKVFLKRILKEKRENAKMRSIARILKTFFVSVVYTRGGDFTYLEVVGSTVNVEIADYVAGFLHGELDKLWSHAQRQHKGLKGVVAKNSFFFGIAKGYCNKIDSLKKEYHQDVANALMVIEKKLVEAQAMIYPRLTSSRSNGSYCQASSALGEQVGRKLNINPALNTGSQESGAIGYRLLS
jgi:hypothetical protein